MPRKSKKQLVAEAKALGVAIDRTWTREDIEEALAFEKADRPAPAPARETEPAPEPEPMPAPLAPVPTQAPPAPVPVPVPPPAPVPVPPAAPKPQPSAPSTPLTGLAGKHVVLWRITYRGEVILPGTEAAPTVVDLDGAAARSLADQGAVVHVSEYADYLARAKAQPTVKPTAPREKPLPKGPGNYRTLNRVTLNGEVLPAGAVAYFTAEQVVGLTKPGAVAIEVVE